MATQEAVANIDAGAAFAEGFLVVARRMRHIMRPASGGGRLLALWTPAGPEALFVELSRLPADSLRNPEVRKMLSARIDSIPV